MGDVAKTGNIHFFREMPMDSYSGEHEKHIFYFFSLLKFVTRYCSNSSDEKTLKFNKKHQTHRNSKLNRVFKKWKINEKQRTIRIIFTKPFTNQSVKKCVFHKILRKSPQNSSNTLIFMTVTMKNTKILCFARIFQNLWPSVSWQNDSNFWKKTNVS